MSDSYNYAFQEVCKYWIKTNHVYNSNVFIMDRDYFNSLPEDIQAAAIEASEYASDQMNSLMLDREAETEQKLIDNGCTVLEVDTQEFIDYYADFVDTYYPELSDWANRIKAMDPNLEGAAEQEDTVLSLIHISKSLLFRSTTYMTELMQNPFCVTNPCMTDWLPVQAMAIQLHSAVC